MSFFEQLKTAASTEWRAYTEHPFTEGLADGSLTEAAFRHYLVQDYLFLIEFARAYAISRLDRRVCRRPLSGGRGESARAPRWPRQSLRHAGPRGGTDRNLQGSHPARSRLWEMGWRAGKR